MGQGLIFQFIINLQLWIWILIINISDFIWIFQYVTRLWRILISWIVHPLYCKSNWKYTLFWNGLCGCFWKLLALTPSVLGHDDVTNGNISQIIGPFWGEPPVTGGFPSQRPMTQSFDVFFDLHLKKWLSEQLRRRWFKTSSHSLWCHINEALRHEPFYIISSSSQSDVESIIAIKSQKENMSEHCACR